MIYGQKKCIDKQGLFIDTFYYNKGLFIHQVVLKQHLYMFHQWVCVYRL